MSRKYRFGNQDHLHFVTFTTINWVLKVKKIMLWLMERMGKRNNTKSGFQFWQHHNKPCEIWSEKIFQQKINYIHNNPVVSGFVFEPEHWKYSSAVNYSGKKGMLSILYN